MIESDVPDDVDLNILGLEPAEERAYRALVDLAAASPAVLADRLRLPASDARSLLRRLESLGLASRSGGDQERHVAAAPDLALRAMLVARRDELRRSELAINELTELYRRTAGSRAPGDLIEVVIGSDATRQRFEQLQLGAEREVMAFVTAPTVVQSAEDNPAEDAAVRRGVRYRVILERDVLDGPGGLSQAEQATRQGEEVAVVDTLPMKMIVADRSVALVPLSSPGEEPGALVVHARGLLGGLIRLFEWTWDRAAKLHLGAEEGDEDVTALDRKILALLFAGLTDEAVAKQLQLSPRTVQRRVRHLMDLSGATTRLQLGRYAPERGWV
ncbi:helix-turn-helix transcriptional regulator [Nonomuraea soli]|uniref:Sugar-specific transcriptional regulator TrmB n=1 Tax=Nonomuraea soli TaxID=1032476 RepID=A0A7W0CSV1_9ACTN|nr:LuxR family transcriptional regulator [Nonomuraea soli]MBA2896568.1 sugar-specific transcriptional regulator TrmB [Nonomuraea soli]